MSTSETIYMCLKDILEILARLITAACYVSFDKSYSANSFITSHPISHTKLTKQPFICKPLNWFLVLWFLYELKATECHICNPQKGIKKPKKVPHGLSVG